MHLDPKTWWYVVARDRVRRRGRCWRHPCCGGCSSRTRRSGAARPPAWVLDLHRHLGGLAVAFVAVHLAVLPLDTYTALGLVGPLRPDGEPAGTRSRSRSGSSRSTCCSRSRSARCSGAACRARGGDGSTSSRSRSTSSRRCTCSPPAPTPATRSRVGTVVVVSALIAVLTVVRVLAAATPRRRRTASRPRPAPRPAPGDAGAVGRSAPPRSSRRRRPAARARRARALAGAPATLTLDRPRPGCRGATVDERAPRIRAAHAPRALATADGRDDRVGRRQAIAPDARRDSTSAAAKPQSASTSSVCWPGHAGGRWIAPGVRLNRGAGAGWSSPCSSTIVPRAWMCGCVGGLGHREHRREAHVGRARGPRTTRRASSS